MFARRSTGPDENSVNAGQRVNLLGVRYAVGLSVCSTTRISSLARAKYSADVASKFRLCMPPPKLRLPVGGYLAARIAICACSTVSTIGTTMPHAPPSSTR